jgi:hypothetical protein
VAGVGASMGAHGKLAGEGKEGEGEEEAGARLGGRRGELLGAPWGCSSLCLCVLLLLAVSC